MRLGIFLFYDELGKLSDHIVYLLAKFSQHLDRLIIVSNGPIETAEAERVAPYADQIVVRENTGFDVGGYIHGIMSVGFDEIAEYDELVLFNYTVFGPMFELEEMFSTMAERDVDFWGVTQFRDSKKEFLQSYFLVTRKSLHASPEFRDYWLNMPKIESVEDSIQFHEFRFTPHFVDLGFRKSVYVENDETWQGNTTLLDLPRLLEKRLPIIKYRAFNFDAIAIERRGGFPADYNFDVIAERTNYPVDLIWDYILSQTPVDQIIGSITRVAVTDAKMPVASTAQSSRGNAVVFLSVEDELHLEKLESYFSGFDRRKLYAVSSNPGVVAFFADRGWNSERTTHPMTGVPVVAFADRLEGIVSQDDTVFNLSCFWRERNNYLFRDFLIDNYWGPLLSSETTIQSVAREFSDNPRIGLIFAPPDSIFGRTTRYEPLCPRGSNWTFGEKEAPREFQRALRQANWPWRGNAALSGRLARNRDFITRLTELYAKVKHGAAPKVTGIEGVIAEVARTAGYASKLAVTEQQAIKLIARGTLHERDYRAGLQQQEKAFADEVATLRQRTDAQQGAGAKTVADTAKPGEGAALKASLARAEQRAADAEAALEKQKQAQARTARELARLIDQATPRQLRHAAGLEQQADGTVIITGGKNEAGQRVVLSPLPSVLGAIELVRWENGRLRINGWCYNNDDLDELMLATVAEGAHLLKGFSPCINQKVNLGSKIRKALPHENGGFALTLPLEVGRAADPAAFSLVIVNSRCNLAVVVPVREGLIETKSSASLLPSSVRETA